MSNVVTYGLLPLAGLLTCEKVLKNMSGVGVHIRCLRCSSSKVEATGSNATRYVCSDCGQNYVVVIHIVPVDAPKQIALEASLAESGPRTDGRCEVPNEGR